MRMRVKHPKALALATSAVYEIVMIRLIFELEKEKSISVNLCMEEWPVRFDFGAHGLNKQIEYRNQGPHYVPNRK